MDLTSTVLCSSDLLPKNTPFVKSNDSWQSQCLTTLELKVSILVRLLSPTHDRKDSRKKRGINKNILSITYGYSRSQILILTLCHKNKMARMKHLCKPVKMGTWELSQTFQC
jgi:hypothetical protein